MTYRSEERVERPSLGYWVDAAVAENGLARFVCDGPSSVTIQLWLERDQIDAWFTQDRAGWVAADLVTDSTRTPFAIEAMTYDWLVGFWIPELAMLSAGPTPFPSASATAEWLRAFAEATTISVSTPAFDILLTPAEGDPENRAAFVEACLAM